MDQFISFFTDYYKFIVMLVEFVVTSALSIFLGFKLQKNSDKLSRVSSDNVNNCRSKFVYMAIAKLPYWIAEANDLFPNEGIKTGPLKLQYVLNNFNTFLDTLKIDRIDDQSLIEIIENILSCDKNNLKEVSYEENQSKMVERPESVRQDCQPDESAQRSSYYVPRRD